MQKNKHRVHMHLQKFLTVPDKGRPQMIFWFTLSMTFTASFGMQVLQKAFSGEYLIMDDARQYVFWMQRFVDPELFPNDLIADFYQSVSPRGFSGFYQLMAMVGINPIVLNKLLPIVLGLSTTGYCFAVCIELLPVPAMGFVGSLLLSHTLWLHDNLVKAIATGFSYPMFLAFLYYLLRCSWLGIGISIALLGTFYGPLMLVAAGILILRLVCWDSWPIRFSPHRSNYIICAVGIGVALLVILPYLLQSSEFGPAIAAAKARNLPEFLPGGRTSFFYDDQPWNFWFRASRSGIQLSLNPPLLGVGFLLPVLLRFPPSPLAKQVSRDVIVLLQLLLSSLTLFFLAHALLFRLFLPSRYTIHSLTILMAIAAGIALILILDGIFRACSRRSLLALGATVLIGALLILYPSLVWKNAFPRTRYIEGTEPALYEFFQQQPKDILIASLSEEADNLPTFAQRSVLIAWEYALPYQVGYYNQIRQRATDLIRAQYSPDIKLVQDFINTYRIDFFLLDRIAFTPEYFNRKGWFRQWKPLAKEALANLEGDTPPAMLSTLKSCSVFESENLVVLEAECVAAPHK
ncbi:MAG: hypothetical protein AB4426_22845 [Xenococcaceae cyanobacterium]